MPIYAKAKTTPSLILSSADTFPNSVDQIRAQQNVLQDLNPKCLTI